MKEKRDFSLQRRAKPLTPEQLARILRGITTDKDAGEAYESLTGEKILDRGDEE